MDQWQTAHIGFGGNMGNPETTFREALEVLGGTEAIRLMAVSSLYRTRPIGLEDQAWFLNGALACRTRLDPHALLRVLLAIEKRFGRERTVRWGPRTLDLDLLFYGGLILDTAELTVPHPRAHERRFVLEPLQEIAPDLCHPRIGRTVSQLLEEPSVQAQAVERWKPL
ncbi:2-amino-4-hydroxy-6-hydroxymethyldihydropteridinediphosphokinase [Desulfacinum hydrothermale DSM 13146]|uniref:2-amino-4-hydroxy-6-hydroxymethyldihydropteridine pyrophosphokinase n=1 Tax=Desulfacinum hydrothermale DSM 13146 TaxID=1121390 RepID=A0A1W1X8C8_9BACT|nr:2-amino-4-hydroxy-6-hydroxymethyldihydropteridine diphosphokinase [Desulfacinum hydrothermale]SMC20186.1 2-amino-4-hydroxy-6-hydroxymethyldihydropteridinediphosphokinase [Desulfacinum hydrothermale DSM 13146]